MHALAYQSLTDDEAYSLALAQRSFGQMLHLYKFESNGLVYSLVLWPLVRIGESASLLRLPAAVAGIAAVPALYWAGRELAGRRAATIAAALLAVSPMAVRYSQFARPFGFALLFTSLSFACLVRALRTGRPAWLAAYAVCVAAATYSNTLAPLMLAPAQAFLVAFTGRRLWRRWLAAWAGAAVLLVPLALLTLSESSRRDALYWLGSPTPSLVARVVEEFLLGRASTAVRAVFAAAVLGAAGIALLLGRAAWPVRRRLASRSALGHPAAAAAAWCLLPFAVALAVSAVQPIFFGAYLVEALPGLCLLLAICAVSIPVRPAAVGVAALGAAWLVATISMGRPPPQALDFRDATAWIGAHRLPGDPLLVDPVSRLPGFAYYGAALRAPDGRIAVKEWHDAPFPRDVVGLTDPGGYGDAPPGPPSVRLMRSLAARTGRVLVALPAPTGQGDVTESPGIRWLRRACTVRFATYGDIDVVAAAGCDASRG